ncbi:MAG: CRISPR-associated protein Cas5 [Ignavibacteriae bacterium]|nr:MAG: CRISPR-associated protein Cas5 [Ignavibacteriota bacterium]
MEILCFKIRGKLAHFRKYYANNTAFSFTIPPRTSLMGITAAVMGWNKDSYYEDLASEKIRFGIRVLSPLKKGFHRLNLLSIKAIGDMAKKWTSDFRGEGGRIQTPFEIVSCWDIRNGDVVYQVFLAPTESGDEIFKLLKEQFLKRKPVFGISLGTANFISSISDIELVEEDKIIVKPTNDYVLMNTAVPTKLIEDLKFDKEEYANYNFVEEDMMPGDFIENGNREVRKMNQLFFSITCNPIRIKLKSPYYEVSLKNEIINLQFMDA